MDNYTALVWAGCPLCLGTPLFPVKEGSPLLSFWVLCFSPGMDLLFPTLRTYLLQLNCFNNDVVL